MQYELQEFFSRYGYDIKERGNEVYLKFCPYCETEQDGDFSHLSFNGELGVFHCKKCDVKGNLYKFQIDQGHQNPLAKARKKPYVRPEENEDLTTDMDKFYAWYFANRGLNPSTLDKYQVGLLKQGEKRFTVHQFYDEDNHLVNRKYRNCKNKKEQWQEKDAEPIYYGLQFVNFDDKILFITEGEDDCMALAQLGVTNVVSVPHGATNYTPAMDKINKKMKELVLCFDNDPVGQKGSKKFASKAGYHKCRNVVLPFKDARDCIQNGMDLQQFIDLVSKSPHFRHESLIQAADLKEEVLSRFDENSRATGIQVRNKEVNKILGGVRGSEMTTWTGHTGHGKSTSAYNLAMWVADEGFPVLIMSFENRLPFVIEKLIEMRTGEKIREFDERLGIVKFNKDKAWVSEQVDSLTDHPVYFLDTSNEAKGYYNIDSLESIVEYAHKFHDVFFVVIDHLHYFLKIKRADQSVYEIDEAVRRIKQMSNRLDIHIILVAHPSKTEDARDGKNVKLGLNCIKGSSAIPQESDNFVVVSRPAEDDTMEARWRIIKNRAHGRLGKIDFKVAENGNTLQNSEKNWN